MANRKDPPLNDTPKIVPARDEVASYQRQKQGRARTAVPNVSASGGSSTGLKAIVALLVLALGGVGAWAYMTHQQLHATRAELADYTQRLQALEQRLSLTDESVEMSSEAMKVKISELDTEIRKLWDNVWKRSKRRLAALEKSEAEAKAFIAATKKRQREDKLLMESLNEELNKITRVEAQVAAAETKLTQQRKNLESAVDKANRAVADIAKLQRRVEANEEWIESINAFRKQINQEIIALKQRIATP